MQKGFSLVELSIVLVILGLLTGGILTGQNLIRAAELRSVTTEFQTYQTAVMTFRDKYFALPGDMRNATDFWGQMTNCGVASPSGTGAETCNGDGDGSLIEGGGSASQTHERFGFWQHLANAGLIDGKYTGIAGADGAFQHILSENAPSSRISNAGFGVNEAPLNGYGSGPGIYTGTDSNRSFLHYIFGGQTSNAIPYAKVLAPEEVWNMDQKIDDGRPGFGIVTAPNSITCTTTAVTDTAEYNLANSSKDCYILLSM